MKIKGKDLYPKTSYQQKMTRNYDGKEIEQITVSAYLKC